ncbi:lipase family protein [Nocardia sp. NPDC006044]|uniref:lipase family protein n=1 Tax=Nocardia sp. NPDC006044 TaxID=3364306 RepID=UPI00367DD083
MAICSGLVGVPHSSAQPGLPPYPVDDPFYAQPQSLADAEMGAVVDSRMVTLDGFLAKQQYTAWQLKYVSQDTQGNPWTAMATVIKPRNSIPGRLFAYIPWIDALDSRCNPSYQLRAGLPYQSTTGMITELRNVADLVDRGLTVVVPDNLGPFNQFAAGYVEGRSVLDGIRAAENFGPAELPGAGTAVGVFGYSGGARGAEFAAELAPDYAPELNLVGTVAGGLPADMASAATLMNGGPFAGINLSSSFGIARAYPELNIPALYSDPGLGARLGGLCAAEVLASYGFTSVQDYSVNRAWPLAEPAVAPVLESLRAGNYGTPATPVYLFMAIDDEIAPIQGIDDLVSTYCGKGLDVTYVKYPVVEHVAAELVGLDPAMRWLDDRFAGVPAANTCAAPGRALVG